MIPRHHRMVVALWCVWAVAGCASDPKAPTKENFARAIRASIAQKPDTAKLCLVVPNMPALVPVHPIRDQLFDVKISGQPVAVYGIDSFSVLDDGQRRNDEDMVKLKALASVGLVAHESRVESYRTNMFTESSKNGPSAPVTIYSEKPHHDYCYATLDLDRIDNFSVPGDMLGRRVTDVVYHTKLMQTSDWARDPAMRSAFPEMVKAIEDAQTQPKDVTLLLTDNGWQTP